MLSSSKWNGVKNFDERRGKLNILRIIPVDSQIQGNTCRKQRRGHDNEYNSMNMLKDDLFVLEKCLRQRTEDKGQRANTSEVRRFTIWLRSQNRPVDVRFLHLQQVQAWSVRSPVHPEDVGRSAAEVRAETARQIHLWTGNIVARPNRCVPLLNWRWCESVLSSVSDQAWYTWVCRSSLNASKLKRFPLTTVRTARPFSAADRYIDCIAKGKNTPAMFMLNSVV
jgi:hypothetical protein